MRRRFLRPSLACLTAIAAARAQEDATAADIAALVPVQTRYAAASRLLARGAPAVAPLCEFAVRSYRDQPDAAATAVRVLIAIGPRSRSEVRTVQAAKAGLEPLLAEPEGRHRLAPGAHTPLPGEGTSPMQHAEFFIGLEAATAAMGMDPAMGTADCIAAIADDDLARALAAALAVAERGTEARAAVRALQELRRRMRELPFEQRGPRIDDAVRRVTVGTKTLFLSSMYFLDDLVCTALVAVDPGHPDTMPIHLVRLRAREPAIRAESARILGQIGPAAAGATPSVCTAAREIDPMVAREAVTALGAIGVDTAIVRRVLQIAQRGSNKDVAARATAALAQLDQRRGDGGQRK